MLATLLLASSASALSATSWQKRLDRAVLDVDLSVEQRVRNLQRVVQATPEVLSDVRSAVDAVRVKGFAEGHVEFLDTLFPVGTTARSDLEGLQALRKQVPEVRAALRTQAAPSAPPAVDSAEATKAAKQIAKEVAGLRDTKKRKALEEEIKNAFRSTPKGLETPTYAVEETLGAVELRAYEPYAVAALKEAKADGAGFNTLAAFLFGKNDEEKAMDMTMPVEMTDGKMAFVLPKADEAAPPTPDDAEVVIERRAARLVAAVAFAGIATPEEVERQRARLAAALAETDAVAADGDEYTVLQYNAPYTIPWRRRNELVVPVTRAAAGPPTAAAWRAACDASGVTSYADFGVKLGASAAPAIEPAASPAPASPSAPTAAEWRAACDASGVTSYADFGVKLGD